MPFTIVRNDITNMQVDAIVNTADPMPVVGGGTDAAIHQKAGPQLLQARQAIGPIAVGCTAVTPAFGLDAQYVIHTVGPVWQGGDQQEEMLLSRCYDNALAQAQAYGCSSVAFPLIATGNYGFPKDKALDIAINAFSRFLQIQEMHIYLVVFDGESYGLSETRFPGIASYIDRHYVDTTMHSFRRAAETLCMPSASVHAAPVARRYACDEMAIPQSLEELLRQEDAGFTETLLKRIDAMGKKDSEIYKRANLSKQHFSKIRNNPHYKPTKATAIALALALELSLEDTRDLIGRAGYALTNSSKFDLIIRYFIEQGKYNVMEINLALYEFDQPLLGA